jgi:glycosyltransferase involved in cell wall biosynthesis
MCASGSKPRLKYLQKLAIRLNIDAQVIWHLKVPQTTVIQWLAGAAISLAPLVECSRNLVQGCCPLKIVESMATGTPVIASDLPVVRELLEHGNTGWLVRPDRPSELARAIRILLAHPEQRASIGANARDKFSAELTWQISAQALTAIYREL